MTNGRWRGLLAAVTVAAPALVAAPAAPAQAPPEWPGFRGRHAGAAADDPALGRTRSGPRS